MEKHYMSLLKRIDVVALQEGKFWNLRYFGILRSVKW